MTLPNNTSFTDRRRQRFLDEDYYAFLKVWDPDHTLKEIDKSLSSSTLSPEMRFLERLRKADEMYEMFSRDYTAGSPPEELRQQFEYVALAYSEAAAERREFEREPAMPLFDFKNIDDYARTVALISLAILLHREDLIPSVHALVKGGAPDESDALVEDLLGKYMSGRPVLDTWMHEEPYGYLLDATADTPVEEKQDDIAQFLKAWYPGMKGSGWYDSHKHQNARGAGGYFGYWAFEAAAIAYLYDIDDTPFRKHLVYPKDLADFARSISRQNFVQAFKTQSIERCEGGQLCPKSGWWHTPAREGSRQRFEAGAIMPKYASDYGSTIWQWDVNQSAPASS